MSIDKHIESRACSGRKEAEKNGLSKEARYDDDVVVKRFTHWYIHICMFGKFPEIIF